MSTHAPLRSCLAASLVCGLAAALSAQPTPPSAEFFIQASSAFASAAQINGEDGADLTTAYARTSVQLKPQRVGQGALRFGVEAIALTTNAEDLLPVPEDQFGAGLEVIYSQPVFGDKMAALSLRPTYFGQGFNLTGAAFLRWQQTPSLSFAAGVAFSTQGDRAVLPIFGLRWQASEALSFTLGAPRTEIAYAFSPTLVASLGASAIGATFKVDDVQRLSPTGKNLDDTWVDYREVRVGPALTWTALPTLSVAIEAGLQVDRRFDYFERDFQLRTADSPYVALSLTSKF
jgi:Domain of unknown function (DUF6268)